MHNEGEIRLGRLYLDKARIEEMDRRISHLFLVEKPYLRANYTLDRLAQDIHVSLHHLSAFVNHYYDMNFKDFINKTRIRYCISKITREELKYKKIEAIAREYGFSNRNTFRLAFKRSTGMTPSQYLKQKKASDAGRT
jgi:AraC-like DNA-binding protein